MKKSIIYLFSVLLCLSIATNFYACKKSDNLMPYVSELKSDIFTGSSSSYNLKECYGFKEQPFINDGEVGEKFNILTFKLLDKETENATYTITYNYNDTEFKQDFKPSVVTGGLTVDFYIDNFTEKQFTVNISSGSNVEQVTLNSILPNNTITASQALNYLKTHQSKLIEGLTDSNGKLTCEIYARVIVKNGNPYWYIGLALGSERLKALLINGVSGEVLAVREII